MNVLVVNCGSSSLKFQLINYDNRDVLAKGLCERIGIDGRLVYEPKNGEKEVTEAAMPTHVEAIQMVLDAAACHVAKTGRSGKREERRHQEPGRSRCHRTPRSARRNEDHKLCYHR